MEREDLVTLRILDEVERNSETSQRQLARNLEVSLGLVNAFMKRLYRKGYFKVTTMPRRRVKYLLTPKGVMEKSRLTLEYIDYSLGFFRQVRRDLKTRVQALREEGVREVALVGTGELAELAYLSLREGDIRVSAVAAGPDEEKDSFLGNPVLTYEQLARTDWQVVLLAVTHDLEDLRRRLARAGITGAMVRNLLEG